MMIQRTQINCVVLTSYVSTGKYETRTDYLRMKRHCALLQILCNHVFIYVTEQMFLVKLEMVHYDMIVKKQEYCFNVYAL